MDWMNGLVAFCRWVLSASIKASVLVGLIGLIRILTKNRLPAKWRHALWFLLVIRLMLPTGIKSRMSVFNWIAPAPPKNVIFNDVSKRVAGPFPSSGVRIPQVSTPGPMRTPAEKKVAMPTDEILSLIWLLGALGFIMTTCIGIFRLRKKLRSKQIVNHPELIRLLDECRSRMEVTSSVRMFRIHGLRIPLLYGSIRPCILLPWNISDWQNRDELRHILCHELAHYKRMDIAVGCLATLLQIVHWFNPLIWFAFHRMRVDRELACDDLTISRLGVNQSQSYGRTLISLLDRLSSTVQLPMTAGIFDMKSGLKRRMAMIAGFRKKSIAWSFIASAILIAAGCFALTEARKAAPPLAKKPADQSPTVKDDSTMKNLSRIDQETKNPEEPLRELRIVVGNDGITCNDRTIKFTDDKFSQMKIAEKLKPLQYFQIDEKKIIKQLQQFRIDKNTVINIIPGENVNLSLYRLIYQAVNTMPVKAIKVVNSRTGVAVTTAPCGKLNILEWTNFDADHQSVRIDDKWGFRNRNKEIVIQPQFDQVIGFSEGLSAVKQNGNWGYIDSTGKWAIPPVYERANLFKDGLAPVKKDEKCGFIDKTGKIAIPFQFEKNQSFSEGLAAVMQKGKWGFIDIKGKMIIGCQFDEAWDFWNGFACVRTDGNWGHIDKKGNIVVPLIYRSVDSFFEGLAAVKTDNGKFGYVDTGGRMKIMPKYDYASEFQEGLAAVGADNHKIGFIDANGRMVIGPKYESAFPFSAGLTIVTIFEDPEKGVKGQGLHIDRAGNILKEMMEP